MKSANFLSVILSVCLFVATSCRKEEPEIAFSEESPSAASAIINGSKWKLQPPGKEFLLASQSSLWAYGTTPAKNSIKWDTITGRYSFYWVQSASVNSRYQLQLYMKKFTAPGQFLCNEQFTGAQGGIIANYNCNYAALLEYDDRGELIDVYYTSPSSTGLIKVIHASENGRQVAFGFDFKAESVETGNKVEVKEGVIFDNIDKP
jgi:hypothetical protein